MNGESICCRFDFCWLWLLFCQNGGCVLMQQTCISALKEKFEQPPHGCFVEYIRNTQKPQLFYVKKHYFYITACTFMCFQ